MCASWMSRATPPERPRCTTPSEPKPSRPPRSTAITRPRPDGSSAAALPAAQTTHNLDPTDAGNAASQRAAFAVSRATTSVPPVGVARPSAGGDQVALAVVGGAGGPEPFGGPPPSAQRRRRGPAKAPNVASREPRGTWGWTVSGPARAP